MYRVAVRVTLRPSILDPQGKAIARALTDLGHTDVREVRTGRAIELLIDAPDAAAAEATARTACERLLANPVTEDFAIESVEAAEATALPA